MKARFLFPYYARFVGYGCIVVHIPIVLFLRNRVYQGFPDHPGLFHKEHLFFMATAVLVTVGLLLVAFSREKIEDEQILQLRLDSLQWAIYLNYFILLMILIFTYDMKFNHVMELNLWGPLLFFILRFRWVIYRLNRSLNA